MKILILSDLHLVAPSDPHREDHEKRAHFVQARRSLPLLKKQIHSASPDFIISLGDLVDWYSPENRDFALDFLQSLSIPWTMTPGNHDSAAPPHQNQPIGLDGWAEAGIETSNRLLPLDHIQAFLLNSHNSGASPGTASWLGQNLEANSTNAIFTHVPPDTPEVRQAILDREPHRNLQKYVQSQAPDLFANHLAGKIDLTFSGHLHFDTTARQGRTHFHILPLALPAHGKTYPEQGTLCFLDTATLKTERMSYL